MNKKTIIRLTAAILCAMLCTLGCAGAEPLPEAGSEEFFEARELVARVVECTLPDASYVARLALAALIVNRTTDPRFPDDIYSVVYERGAFECVASAKFERTHPTYLSKAAARDALLGFDVTSGAVYFKKSKASEAPDGCFYHSGYVFSREYI